MSSRARPRAPRRLIICLFGVTAAIAQPAADSIQAQQVGPNGVQEVVSRAPGPLPPPWRLEEDLVIGVEYGNEEYMIRGPRDFTVLEDGTIVILDDRPVQLRLYSGEGRFLRAFGETGSGPTDLHMPFAVGRGVIRPSEPGRFEIWSGWPTWIQTWDTTGDMVSVRTLSDRHPIRAGRATRIRQVRGEEIYPIVLRSRRGQQNEFVWITDLHRTDWNGTRLDTLRVTVHTTLPQEAGWYLELGGPMPMDQVLVTTAGRLYVTNYEEDWVRELDRATGEELLRFRWEHQPASFTEIDVGTMDPGTAERVKTGFEAYKERVSIMHLAEGPNGEIWVQRIGYARDGAPVTLIHPFERGTWPTDMFSSTGEYRGRMILPYEPRTQKMFGDALYAIGSTGDGVPALIRYRLLPSR